MRIALTLSVFLSCLASSVTLAEVFHNVASKRLLADAETLGHISNALTLHEKFRDDCDLAPLLDQTALKEAYAKLTWSLSPSDLALVQQHFAKGETTWNSKDGGVPANECDNLSQYIIDFRIGIADPDEAIRRLFETAPRGTARYTVYAAAAAWGAYLRGGLDCTDYIVPSVPVHMLELTNRNEFRIMFTLSEMAALKVAPSCQSVEALAREGGVFRPRK